MSPVLHTADWSVTNLLVAMGHAEALVWYGPLGTGNTDSDSADLHLDVAGTDQDMIGTRWTLCRTSQAMACPSCCSAR